MGLRGRDYSRSLQIYLVDFRGWSANSAAPRKKPSPKERVEPNSLSVYGESNAPPEVYLAVVEEAVSSTPTAVQIQPRTKEPMIPAMTL